MSLSSFPKRITLELTNYCNLSCVFCPRRYMEQEFGHLDVSLAKTLIDEMSQHIPVSVVPFFRGESLMHPQWDTILGYLHEKNIKPIQFTTNATLLTPVQTERLLDIGVDFLSFSIDTTNHKLYKELRGGDYHNSLKNILRFLQRKEERNTQMTIQVSAVKTTQNAHDIENFIHFWSSKVDRIRIYEEHSRDGVVGRLDKKPQVSRKACHKVFEDMVIYWNGDVALCNHDWTRRVTGQHIANVKNKGIASCWDSPAYHVIRKAHEEVNLTGINPCESCDHWVVSHIPEYYIGQVFHNHSK